MNDMTNGWGEAIYKLMNSETRPIEWYLDELKARMIARDEDRSGDPNAVDKGYHLAVAHMCEEIDVLLQEVGK